MTQLFAHLAQTDVTQVAEWSLPQLVVYLVSALLPLAWAVVELIKRKRSEEEADVLGHAVREGGQQVIEIAHKRAGNGSLKARVTKRIVNGGKKLGL